jgi:hypothetical protein
MNKGILLIALYALLGCSGYGQVEVVTKLPEKLNENSGLAVLDSASVWIIEDGGNEDKIYEVDFSGKILKDFEVKNAKNNDWEDLAADSEGNLYIADTGNNSLKREELVIYKVRNPTVEHGDKIPAEEIRFHYAPSQKHSHKKKFQGHDAEALFFKEDFLYIITKDRGTPFTGEACIFKVPAVKGSYEARLVGRFTPCGERGSCEITAADISPEGKKIALLGYGRLWIFSDFTGDDFTKGSLKSISLGFKTQLESVAFLDENTLLLSDEEQGSKGRTLYRFYLD